MKNLVATLCLLLYSGAAWAQDGAQRVVVGFNGDPDETVFAKNGGQSIKTLRELGAVVGHLPVGKIEDLKLQANVSYVEPDPVASIVQAHANGKNPSGGGYVQPAQEVPWGVTRIGARTIAFTGMGVLVGIVDTGIDRTHPDLAANIVGGTDTVMFGDNDYSDDNSHGTHVAGTIAGVDNTIGVVGVAPQAGLWIAKSLNRQGSGSYSDLAEGILACKNAGVRVISMSWGGSSTSTTLTNALQAAANAQIVLVAASGNSGIGKPIGYPAADPNVLAIGASDKNDQLAWFTSTAPTNGKGVDIVAPGVEVRSTVKGGKYDIYNGTSMATPHVSAVAALIIQSKGFAIKSDVDTQLKSTAETVPTLPYKLVSASGAVQ